MDIIKAYFNNDKFFPLLVKELKDYAIFLMTLDGRIASWNEGAEAIKGYAEKEVLGSHYRLLFPQRLQKEKKPEKELVEALKSGRFENHDWRRKKNGEEFWARVILIALYDDNEKPVGLAKITQDLTNERKIEEKLKKHSNDAHHAKEFSEAILDTVNEGIVVLNEKKWIVNANKTYYDMFKLKADNVIKSPLVETHPRWRENDLQQVLHEMIEKEIYFKNKEIEFEIKGDSRTFSVTSKFIHHNQNTELKVLLVFTDVTIKNEIEKAKSDFTSFVSHELRTPITNIKAYVQLMERCLRGKNECNFEKYLSKTLQFTDDLNVMVEELHESNKAGADKIQITKRKLNIEELIDDTLEVVKAAFPKIEIVKEGEAKVIINGDSMRLTQVLTNYITNANKYSGGKKVIVKLILDKQKVTVEVKDKGKGIAKEELNKLFSRYYRTKSSMKIEGLGMGLFLVKKIIKAHKGEVGAKSDQGKGSTFFFTLPVVSRIT